MQLSPNADFEVHVNGDPHRVPAGTHVSALLEQIGLSGRRVAVAINREIVRRGMYRERMLAEGDRVEVLEAVGGVR